MNMLSRAIAGELMLSPRSTSTKCLKLLILHQQQQQQIPQNPVGVLQNHSSQYSTTTASSIRSKNQRDDDRKAKPRKQPARPSRSFAEMVQKQTQMPEIEMDIEKGLIEEEEESSTTDWERPSEIPWQAMVANSVNLIGRVQIPVQFEASSDGKCWAGTIISQRDGDCSSNSPPFWIPIIFEGDLAHIAACHLKANDRVHIEGQLSADPPPSTLHQVQANVQVMVRSINFVESSSQTKKALTPGNLEQCGNNGAASMKDDISVNQSWKSLFVKPHEWWDLRSKKGNSMAASFENKDNGQLLWINESTPEWIQKKVENLTFDHKLVQKSVKSVSDMKADGDTALNPWKDLLRNPHNWQDYRKNKLNGLLKANYPDFKHKDTGLALWLDSAPKWVLSELDGLQSNVQLPKVKQTKKSKGDDSWKNLVENPNDWWDNRANKVSAKSPDFKHKGTGEALWLNGSPDWVLSRLPPLKAKHTANSGKWNKPPSKTI